MLFELPVLPRVRKYLRVKLADAAGQPQPLLISPELPGPSMLLWALAQSEKVALSTGYAPRPGGRGCQRPGTSLRHNPDAMTERIGVGISEFHPSRHQYLLNNAELWVFSNLMDHMIRNELIEACRRQPDRMPMSLIKAFCDRYDFSSLDYSEEALRQAYLRHRKKVAASAYSPQLVRGFELHPLVLAA